MKTISKTMETLIKYQKNRVDEAMHDYQTECVEDIIPLRLDEADELELAQFFVDWDHSFLFATIHISPEITTKRKRPADECKRDLKRQRME
jgi:hypothetical protein